MTEEKAEMLARELRGLLVGEQVILVEAYEWEGFVPKHVSLMIAANVSSVQEKQNYVLRIVLCVHPNAIYGALDNPVIDQKTILFSVVNETGQKIYRSLTLAREFRDDAEMVAWVSLKYALI